jgi:speckle-type POZ protein
VTFSVGGELFDAHMFVLALRSPVFKEELFGGTLEMGDNGKAQPIIVVENMRPDVFQALLCYIYTDDLPPAASPGAADHQADEEDENDMLVRGLKLLCDEILRRKLDAANVAKMLAFADDHSCSTLRDACVDLMADPDVMKMKEVVASQGYQQLRLKHPLVLLDVLEKCIMFGRV